MKPMSELTQHLRKKAYQIWLDEGRLEGRERIHWQKALHRERLNRQEDYLRYWAANAGAKDDPLHGVMRRVIITTKDKDVAKERE
jgi:hypothetical protein